MSVVERANQTPEILRKKRARLFKAFDIYKQNVAYKLVSETKDRHAEIVDWYERALDLDFNAMTDYPEELEAYL